MAKLTTNVVLRSPETGMPVVLVEGSEVPKWADELVGDHARSGATRAVKSKTDDK